MRRLSLSAALLAGSQIYGRDCDGRYLDETTGACDPIGAIFLGTLHGPADVAKFQGLIRNQSYEGTCDFVLRGVMKAYPVLGMSLETLTRVRRVLAKNAPEPFTYKTDKFKYEKAQHPSLLATILHLYQHHDWDKGHIALRLEEAGL